MWPPNNPRPPQPSSLPPRPPSPGSRPSPSLFPRGPPTDGHQLPSSHPPPILDSHASLPPSQPPPSVLAPATATTLRPPAVHRIRQSSLRATGLPTPASDLQCLSVREDCAVHPSRAITTRSTGTLEFLAFLIGIVIWPTRTINADKKYLHALHAIFTAYYLLKPVSACRIGRVYGPLTRTSSLLCRRCLVCLLDMLTLVSHLH